MGTGKCRVSKPGKSQQEDRADCRDPWQKWYRCSRSCMQVPRQGAITLPAAALTGDAQTRCTAACTPARSVTGAERMGEPGGLHPMSVRQQALEPARCSRQAGMRACLQHTYMAMPTGMQPQGCRCAAHPPPLLTPRSPTCSCTWSGCRSRCPWGRTLAPPPPAQIARVLAWAGITSHAKGGQASWRQSVLEHALPRVWRMRLRAGRDAVQQTRRRHTLVSKQLRQPVPPGVCTW